MGLQEYKRKRDFKKTPEPAPAAVKKTKGHAYLIQKHDATRLHYDFRLELDGVLLSWAVTKGPSLNPKDKRLAVRTEDHPLSYGSFEGVIPQGQYGGGTVMLWDQGSWTPKGDPRAGLKKGHLSFTLHGQRLKGDWALIRMRGEGKRENWLLVKENDDEANADDNGTFLDNLSSSITTGRAMADIAAGKSKKRSVAKPAKKAPVKKKTSASSLEKLVKQYPDVQLATLVDQPPQGDNWIHEIKYDGYRLLGFLSDGDVRLLTRNGNDWTDKFPAIGAAIQGLKAESAVIDLEAVVLDDQGKTGFQALQAALSEGGDTESIIGYAFDILHLDGEDLTSLSLLKRKEVLKKLLKSRKSASLLYSDHVTGHGTEMISKSCSLGLEGIISKLSGDIYHGGRGKGWLKSKCIKRQEFIILGYAKARSGGRSIGALYLGYYDKKQLKYAGKVGTGFTMESAAAILKKLTRLETKKKPDLNEFPGIERSRVHWVQPSLLCEIAFTEWTSDGHIRHPSFQGLREDKSAKNVIHEKAVPVDTAAKPKKPLAAKGRLMVGDVSISHPERLVFEDIGVTKGELAEYYETVASLMLKQIANRPISLLRCPDGTKGQCFFQRSANTGLGPDVYPFKWKHKGKSYEYIYVKDTKGLLEMVQMGVIEIHPWGSTVKNIDYPDRVIFDLDPDEKVPFVAVKLAAKDVRKRLKKMGLDCYLKSTGGKGLHIVVPLAEKDPWPKVKAWAESFANQMVQDVPQAYVATMTKSKRTGKIFIDYFRNDYTATSIADYAVRARPGAPVAMPLDWKDLDRLKAANAYNIRDVLKLAKKGKLSPDFKKKPQRIPKI